MRVNIRAFDASDLDAVRQLLFEGGWRSKLDDPAKFELALANSQIALVATEGARIVGFARAITDGVFNGYISMVVVAPDQQRRGLGTALVRAVMGSNRSMTWVLRADRDGVAGFYEKLGFVRSGSAMERRRG